MFSIAAMYRNNVRGDVRINEQYNSLIRQQSERCRRISLPLLSSRCNLKKFLNVGTRGASTRWSVLKPRAEILLKELLNQHAAAQEIIAEDNRWAVAPPHEFPADIEQRIKLCSPAPMPARAWATSYSMYLHHCCPAMDVRHFIMISDITETEAGDEDGTVFVRNITKKSCYFICDKNYSQSTLLRCILSPCPPEIGDLACLNLSFASPVDALSSVSLFERQHAWLNTSTDDPLEVHRALVILCNLKCVLGSPSRVCFRRRSGFQF
jgi:hypothetical protein